MVKKINGSPVTCRGLVEYFKVSLFECVSTLPVVQTDMDKTSRQTCKLTDGLTGQTFWLIGIWTDRLDRHTKQTDIPTTELERPTDRQTDRQKADRHTESRQTDILDR